MIIYLFIENINDKWNEIMEIWKKIKIILENSMLLCKVIKLKDTREAHYVFNRMLLILNGVHLQL